MIYNSNISLGYLAALQALEDAHTKAVNEQTEIFLKQALSIEPGTVVEVAPRPKQYFSRSRRFLIFRFTAHLGRDKKTLHYAGVQVSVEGVFLHDDGRAMQSVQQRPLPEGQYHTEQILLHNSKFLAADIDRVSDDQSHQVQWQ
jgi:hypothetical protein